MESAATSAESGVSHARKPMVALHPRCPAVANAAKRASARRILPLETLRSETFTGLPGTFATPNCGDTAANTTTKCLSAAKPFS
jgi:hypothetical protein